MLTTTLAKRPRPLLAALWRWKWWLLAVSTPLVLFGLWTGFLLHPRYSLLVGAIDNRNEVAVRTQLRLGTNANLVPTDLWTCGWLEDDMTPLNHAIFTGDISMVKLLLDNGADIGGGDGWYGTVMDAAVEQGSTEMIDYLLSRGAMVNESPTMSSGLWTAARNSNINLVKHLLSKGANPDSYFENQGKKVRLLNVVREKNDKAVVDALVNAGAKN